MAKVVIVTGSRERICSAAVHEALDAENPDIVVHGGAVGVDSSAHGWCRLHGKPAIVFFPDYDKYGTKAPLKRNLKMLDTYKNAVVLAFPMPNSKGTWHTAKNAEKKGMTVKVIPWDGGFVG